MSRRSRRPPSTLLVIALALAWIPTASAHEGSSALATWGDLGAASPCQQAVAAATERCINGALAAVATCATTEATACDPQAAIVAARQTALDTIERACA